MVVHNDIEAHVLPDRGTRGVVLGLALLCLAAGRGQAADDSGVRNGFSGFVEAAPHVVIQRARGSIGTNFTLTARKSNYVTNMTFRLGGGLKGPAVERLWGRPRPVIYAGVLLPLNESSTIGSQLIESNPPGFEVVEGAKFSIEYQTSGMAGLGLEFVVPVFDSEIAITPAVESLHLATRYAGQASYTVTASSPAIPDEIHELRGKGDLVQHFLGPAIRVSTPTVVIRGGIAIDFFLGASLLFDVAGTRDRFAVQGEDDDRGAFNFETGTGAAQLSSGLQIRWP